MGKTTFSARRLWSALIASFQVVLLIRSYRVAALRSTGTYFVAYTYRGGADQSKNSSAQEDHAVDSQTQNSRPSLFSLFRLNQEMKAEVAVQSTGNVNITRPTGGAVATKPSPRSRVTTPLDTSQVGTLSNRLLKDEKGSDDDGENDETAGKGTSQRFASKLWWSTMWSTQAPENAEEEESLSPGLNDTDSTETVDKIDLTGEEQEKLVFTNLTMPDNTVNETKHVTRKPKKKRKSKRKSKGSRNTPNFEVVTKLAEPSESTNSSAANSTLITKSNMTEAEWESSQSSSYTSTGHWQAIDLGFSLGLSSIYPNLRISRGLRGVRKKAANITGLHGLLSKKGRQINQTNYDEQPGSMRRRLAAIERARKEINRMAASKQNASKRFSFFGGPRDRDRLAFVVEGKQEEIELERRRRARVQAIDREMGLAQKRLQELACEKDVLQRRLNPLWNYTTKTAPCEKGSNTTRILDASREFSFPNQDLVDDYLDMLFYSGRIVKLNHTDLWRTGFDVEDDDDELGMDSDEQQENGRARRSGNSAGNWLLRHGLGEKIGQAAETAGYKAVCKSVMSVLARSVSSIHGINIMAHSDIRLFVEQTPDLPPISAGIIPGSGKDGNYAQHALRDIMARGTDKNWRGRYSSNDSGFIQREAIVETLLSHCQISAPLLTLFPLIWQRALLGNLVTLITAIVADFAAGLEFQILGHRLAFSFTPITEEDMIRRMGSTGLNRRRVDPAEFEEAVLATADDLSKELGFLDKWHERVLGGDLLRSQIANLIARLVLTLVDDILGDAKMDFWTSHAGGPRLMAGLEFRTTSTYMDEPKPTS